ncbi:hypothetical protein J2S16_000197 [Cytobacillus kochii]|nr:hypothetical protein [Cytobacillus kochii]
MKNLCNLTTAVNETQIQINFDLFGMDRFI